MHASDEFAEDVELSKTVANIADIGVVIPLFRKRLVIRGIVRAGAS